MKKEAALHPDHFQRRYSISCDLSPNWMIKIESSAKFLPLKLEITVLQDFMWF